MFGFALLPIAYVTFFFMMNSKSLLGDNMPTGANRLKWNVLMSIATGLAIVGSFVSIYKSDTPSWLRRRGWDYSAGTDCTG